VGHDADQRHYLVLEDLTQGMRRPCVMDIKIGARTYGPDASPAKQRQEDSKYLGTKKPLGKHTTPYYLMQRSSYGHVSVL
jgi:hypothetical protein